MKLKILLLVLLFSSIDLRAQVNFLDTTFHATGNPKGKKIIGTYGSLNAVAMDGEGKIFLAGTSQQDDTIFVIRLKPDGTTDAPLGSERIATINLMPEPGYSSIITANCLVLQPDGKILIGGSRGRVDTGKDMMVIRLNRDGSRDTTFGDKGIWINKTVAYKIAAVKKMALQSNGKIVVGGNVANTTISTIGLFCLTANGSEDALFTSNLPPNVASSYLTGLEIYKDVIIVGGNLLDANAHQYFLLKLFPNGKPYTEGAWLNNGRIKIPANTLIDLGFGAIAVLPNGDVIIGGSFSQDPKNGFRLARIRADGTSTVSPDLGPDKVVLTNMLLDSDGKLILSGYGEQSYEAIKVDGSGKLDSTFAVNGRFSLYGTSAKARHSTFSKDRKLLLVGEELSANSTFQIVPTILKVYIKPPIYILGSDYVLPNSTEMYKVLVPPGLDNYSFTWSISNGQNVLKFPDNPSLPKIATLFFGSSATKVRLICTATLVGSNFAGSMRVEKDIIVNTNPSSANDLELVQCPPGLSDCGTGYIDYFKLNLIRNDSSGCSSYVDYTKSHFVDTLIVGGVYSATLRVDQPKMYVGIWIDYNDDGIFNTTDEFVAEVFSNNTFIQIPNIILKNESGYFGSKRMRVRCRANTAFNSVESCPIEGEGGETEDYLVVLIQQDKLAAPQIITPNEDGKNDYFVVRGVKPDSENMLTVFDRWGTVKFSAANYENNWNGLSSKGDKLLPGTYYYLFSHNDESIRGFLEIRY